MSVFGNLTIFIFVLFGLQIFADTSWAFSVCDRPCLPTDVACLNAVATCATRIEAYEIYMSQMGADQTKHELPAVYQDILRSRYQTNFSAYRVAFSDRQPPHNATTDCFTTYFNDRDFVDALVDAGPNLKWKWFLHEVTHAEQCSAIGGREFYANRWWNELTAAANAAGRSINFNTTPQALAGQIGMLFASLHDSMPMEAAADAKADLVFDQLEACCISKGQRPIRPLKLGAISSTPDPPGSTNRYLLSVSVVNGDSPFKTKWEITNPGQAGFVPMPDSLDSDQRVLWTPKKDKNFAQVQTNTFGTTYKWTYQIRATVSQQNPNLGAGTATRTITLGETSRIFAPLDDKKEPSIPPPNR